MNREKLLGYIREKIEEWRKVMAKNPYLIDIDAYLKLRDIEQILKNANEKNIERINKILHLISYLNANDKIAIGYLKKEKDRIEFIEDMEKGKVYLIWHDKNNNIHYELLFINKNQLTLENLLNTQIKIREIMNNRKLENTKYDKQHHSNNPILTFRLTNTGKTSNAKNRNILHSLELYTAILQLKSNFSKVERQIILKAIRDLSLMLLNPVGLGKLMKYLHKINDKIELKHEYTRLEILNAIHDTIQKCNNKIQKDMLTRIYNIFNHHLLDMDSYEAKYRSKREKLYLTAIKSKHIWKRKSELKNLIDYYNSKIKLLKQIRKIFSNTTRKDKQAIKKRRIITREISKLSKTVKILTKIYNNEIYSKNEHETKKYLTPCNSNIKKCNNTTIVKYAYPKITDSKEMHKSSSCEIFKKEYKKNKEFSCKKCEHYKECYEKRIQLLQLTKHRKIISKMQYQPNITYDNKTIEIEMPLSEMIIYKSD